MSKTKYGSRSKKTISKSNKEDSTIQYNKDDPRYDPGNIKKIALTRKYGSNYPMEPSGIGYHERQEEYKKEMYEYDLKVDQAIQELRDDLKANESEFEIWREKLPADLVLELEQHHSKDSSTDTSSIKKSISPKFIGKNSKKILSGGLKRKDNVLTTNKSISNRINDEDSTSNEEPINQNNVFKKMLVALISIDKKLTKQKSSDYDKSKGSSVHIERPGVLTQNISKNLTGLEKIVFDGAIRLKQKYVSSKEERKKLKEEDRIRKEDPKRLTESTKELIESGLMHGRGSKQALKTNIEPGKTALSELTGEAEQLTQEELAGALGSNSGSLIPGLPGQAGQSSSIVGDAAETAALMAAPSLMGKAWDKITGKKTPKEIEKIADSGTKKTLGKRLTKFVGKSALKKIPIIGALAGIGFGAQRALEGDWEGAAAEVASGAAGSIPGVGTAASLAIDAGLEARDNNRAEQMSEYSRDTGIKPIKKSTSSELSSRSDDLSEISRENERRKTQQLVDASLTKNESTIVNQSNDKVCKEKDSILTKYLTSRQNFL